MWRVVGSEWWDYTRLTGSYLCFLILLRDEHGGRVGSKGSSRWGGRRTWTGAAWEVGRTWQLRQSGRPGDAAPYVQGNCLLLATQEVWGEFLTAHQNLQDPVYTQSPQNLVSHKNNKRNWNCIHRRLQLGTFGDVPRFQRFSDFRISADRDVLNFVIYR